MSTRSLFAAFLLSALFPLALSAQEVAPDKTPPPKKLLYTIIPGLKEKTGVELAKELEPAVVTIKNSVGLGSGFFISPDGYLVTCAHCVEGANQGDLTVTVYGKSEAGLTRTDYAKVRIVAYSGHDDLALLKVEPPTPTKFAWVPLGDSTELTQGQKCLLIGSPMGAERTATEGTISNTARSIGSFKGRLFVQTTAPATHGNSGGPLFNMKGEVVGVLSLGHDGAGNLAFASVSDMTKLFLRHTDAFAFDPANPANGFHYLPPPSGKLNIQGPSLMKVSDKLKLLRQGDLDGDGRPDLVAFDPEESCICLFYRRTPEELRKAAAEPSASAREKPILDNAPFLEEKITVPDEVCDIALLDFDGDGKLDIAYTGRRTGLNVLLQTAPGKFEKSLRYDKCNALLSDGTLKAVALAGDGKKDLVMLAQGGKVLVFKGGQRDLGIPREFGTARAGAMQMDAFDVNGDGRPDLVFPAPGSAGRDLTLRIQDADGGFGPEFAVGCRLGAGFAPIENPQGTPTVREGTPSSASFLCMDEAGKTLLRKDLVCRAPDKDDGSQLQPQIVRPPAATEATFLTTTAQLDGKNCVVMADTQGATIHLCERKSDGTLGKESSFPCLRGISSIGALRLPGEAGDRIVVCSADEKTVALSEYKDGRLGFPVPLPVASDPCVAKPLMLGGVPSVVVATRDGQRLNLEVLGWDAPTKSWKSKVVRLGTLARDPSGMLVHDLDGDGKEDILLFFPREPARIILQDAQGNLAEACADSSVRKSQFDGIAPECVGFGDFNGDGKEKVLVAFQGFVRAYAVTPTALTLVDQANSRTTTDNLSAPAMIATGEKGTKQLAVYDADNGALQIFGKTGALHAYHHSLDVGKIAPKEILGSGESILLAGAQQIWNLPLAGKQWLLNTGASCDSGVKDARLFDLAATGSGQNLRVAALDNVNHGVEIFGPDADGASLVRLLHFPVFSDERLVSGGDVGGPQAPREALFLGGSAAEPGCLILLCHDRLLAYPIKP